MSITGQMQSGSDTLKAFYAAVGEYLNAAGTDGDVDSLDGNLPYEDILTYCQQNAQAGGSYAVGLAIEALSELVAVQREIDMTALVKSELYSAAAGEASDEAQMYADRTVYQVSVVNGASTSGSQA